MKRGQRNISTVNEIVVHHGADARKFTLAEMKRIYQDTHYNSLYKKFNQPRVTGADNSDIAYHILVATDGWEVARPFDYYSYHASNLKVNKESIAIVLTGNYDRDHLDPDMDKYFREAVEFAKGNLPSVVKISGHRDYATKSCPGKNITKDYYEGVFQSSFENVSPVGGEDTFDAEDAKKFSTEDILEEVVGREDFIESTMSVILKNIHLFDK